MKALNLEVVNNEFEGPFVNNQEVGVETGKLIGIPVSENIPAGGLLLTDENGNEIEFGLTQGSLQSEYETHEFLWNDFVLPSDGDYTLSIKSDPTVSITLKGGFSYLDNVNTYDKGPGLLPGPDGGSGGGGGGGGGGGTGTTPCSGQICASEIQTVFGGTNPICISEYYGVASGVPSSGTICYSDLMCKSGVKGPTLVSPGYLPNDANNNEVITLNGASKTDGDAPAQLQFRWIFVDRATGAETSGPYQTYGKNNRNLTINASWMSVKAEVQVVDTNGLSDGPQFTNTTLINEDLTICGTGQATNPIYPFISTGTASGYKSVTFNTNIPRGTTGTLYLCWCGFADSNNANWGNGRFHASGQTTGYERNIGGSYTVSCQSNVNIKVIWFVLKVENVGMFTGGSNSNSNYGYGQQPEYFKIRGKCVGSSSHIVWIAANSFQEYNAHVHLGDLGPGWANFGNNYCRMYIKFFDQYGHPDISGYCQSSHSDKIVQVAGTHMWPRSY